ncbi:hypothetical protein [Chryseobacterium sp. ERMR1:04]|uniref:hypothetical protein n=1 Tax=Chryseobacterium sp. ERMR1:04 TaxID=1705393 RepID=UPI0006C84ECD|nr:hypothetical protein [Chryseobacterium sp. ERMR1:04]
MKKYLLFLLFASTIIFGQAKEFPLKNEDFSQIVLNKQIYFEGEISKESPFKLKFENIVKNPDKPNMYFVSGLTEVEGNQAKFLGEMIFTEKYDVRDSPDKMLVFGDFNLIENKSGEHSGIFKGKFRMQINKDLKPLNENFSTITFKGKWKNYTGNLDFDVWWANYTPTNISKIIFK